MIYLRRGDRLPAVGVMQRIINECRTRDSRLASVERLEEDGIFGPRTHSATVTVQQALGLSCRRGVIDPDTWRALATIGSFSIVDVTDLAIEARMAELGRAGMRQRMLDNFRRAKPGRPQAEADRFADGAMRMFDREIEACRSQHNRFISAGGNPIGITSLNDVFGNIRRGLEARSRNGTKVVLLRFTGHGGPASQGVAGSVIGAVRITANTLSFDDSDSPSELVDTVALSGMALPIASFGCVELHGCNVAARRSVGRGREPALLDGPAYVQAFANLIGRPVSGCTVQDLYGTLEHDVRYEGGVVSCVPGGGTVADWFQNH